MWPSTAVSFLSEELFSIKTCHYKRTPPIFSVSTGENVQHKNLAPNGCNFAEWTRKSLHNNKRSGSLRYCFRIISLCIWTSASSLRNAFCFKIEIGKHRSLKHRRTSYFCDFTFAIINFYSFHPLFLFLFLSLCFSLSFSACVCLSPELQYRKCLAFHSFLHVYTKSLCFKAFYFSIIFQWLFLNWIVSLQLPWQTMPNFIVFILAVNKWLL